MKQISYISIFKPAGDFILAISLVIILAPVMLVVIAVNYVLHGHFLFVQNRPGLHGKTFNIYKLKTLIDCKNRDKITPTRFGSFLRKTSLDEVPQLINILKGEMSFIGPRPLLKEYLSLYNSEHSKRHNLLPGITGLAQVSGRNAAPWQHRLDCDAAYVKKVSFKLDIKILLLTFFAVFRTKEVNTDGYVGSGKFQGYYAQQ